MSITKEQAIETLREVVAGHENYVYKPPTRVVVNRDSGEDEEVSAGCWYSAPDGSPSCIVGHVIAKLDPEGFQKIVSFEQTRLESFPVNALIDTDGEQLEYEDTPPQLDIDGQAVKILRAAQEVQDTGNYWRDALGSAERIYTRFTATY